MTIDQGICLLEFHVLVMRWACKEPQRGILRKRRDGIRKETNFFEFVVIWSDLKGICPATGGTRRYQLAFSCLSDFSFVWGALLPRPFPPPLPVVKYF